MHKKPATNNMIFTMAFCLKAMIMMPPVSPIDISILIGFLRTDKNKHVG